MEFNEKGIFWLPEDDSVKLSGILRFDSFNGSELELTGSFADLAELRDETIILGYVAGKAVTLYNCFNYQAPFSVPGFQEQFFKVEKAFMGCHFNEENDIQFKSLSIIYSYLDSWVGRTGLSEERERDPDGNFALRWEFNYPDEIDIQVNNYQLSFQYPWSRERSHFKLNFEQKTDVKIESDNNIHLNEYRGICDQVQNFLSLAVGRAVYPLVIKGENEDYKSEIQGQTVYNNIDIYFRTDPILLSETIDYDEMFFSLSDIQDSLEESLNNWVTKSEELIEIYNLYFSNIYYPDLAIEIKFSNLIRALEVYHRKRFGGGYCTEDEFENVKTELINAIPDYIETDHKNSLKSRIRYGYEFSLRTRLKKIFEQDRELFGLAYDDMNNFINDIVVTRNYLTHFDEDDEENALKGLHLHKATAKLKFFVELCFLFELNISRTEIIELVRRDTRYGDILNIT